MAEPAEKTRLDRLVSDHLPEALRFATRLTGDVDRAEEVVQESLFRVARAWGSSRGEAQFRTWLFRIVINVFRDSLAAPGGAEELVGDVPDRRGADPAVEAEAGELGRLIAARVSALPPRQREVLVLVAFEGLSPRQVAEVLDVRESNVHATLHLARSRLRGELSPYLSKT